MTDDLRTGDSVAILGAVVSVGSGACVVRVGPRGQTWMPGPNSTDDDLVIRNDVLVLPAAKRVQVALEELLEKRANAVKQLHGARADGDNALIDYWDGAARAFGDSIMTIKQAVGTTKRAVGTTHTDDDDDTEKDT